MNEDVITRPNLEDYEFYDPQQMQEYAYHAERYMDSLESEINLRADCYEYSE